MTGSPPTGWGSPVVPSRIPLPVMAIVYRVAGYLLLNFLDDAAILAMMFC